MTVYRGRIHLDTTGNMDMSDITGLVNGIVADSGVNTGTCHVFNVGSTGIIGAIEFEPGLERDFPEMLHKLIPPSREYGHEIAWHDGNGHSHLHASMVGPEITVPVEKGRLCCGVWQQIFHYEADNKARSREIIVTVIGE
jgi:secondary thiamine-phosphate synthase enzyme